MKYLVEKPKRRRFIQDHISKHHKILREPRADADTRIANIHHRNEILKANRLYELKLERDRMSEALSMLPSNQQRNLRDMLVRHRQDLNDAMLNLGKKGTLP